MTAQKIPDAIKGNPLLMGACRVPEGYQFTVEAPEEAEVSLLLYGEEEKKPRMEISLDGEYAVGNVRTVLLPGFSPRGMAYNFKINGEIRTDPWAFRLLGTEKFGKSFPEDPHQIRCGFFPEEPLDWEGDVSPDISFDSCILYKIHVRGYTMQRKMSPSQKGTFSGLIQMIPYWQELGINALELMPACEFPETGSPGTSSGLIRYRRREERVNYWGYVPGYYFAPKRSYCAGKEPEKEFASFVRALHQAGIACIMEMFFPEHISPMLSLRALQFWKLYYHVDGFHLTGQGVNRELILRDPVIAGSFLLLDGDIPAGEIYGNRAPVRRTLARYSPGFMQDMRRFIKSDEGMVASAGWHMRENSPFYGVVNYLASQNGFTLYDAVSYNYRHNEANGEDNRDGMSSNYSWNCGVEGPTRKVSVKRLREQQLRNAFFLLLLSQGVPMIYGGDEFGNSQQGNNNAWCQDNPLGWVDWKAEVKNKSLLSFVKEAIAFRKAHPALHQSRELTGGDPKGTGIPDISFHGEFAWYLNQDNDSRLLGVMINGSYAQREDGTPDDFLFIACNFHWEKRKVALPALPGERVWRKAADTADWKGDSCFGISPEICEKQLEILPRAVVVLLGRQE